VTAYDGQTVAIGGLIREDVQIVDDRVPLLGDLPLIGRLFQTQAEARFKNNLMMFVTASVIDPAGRRLSDFAPVEAEIDPMGPAGSFDGFRPGGASPALFSD
jgi:general secretion pathway protein D